MGHLAFVVFLLSWGLVGQASASNAGRAGPVSAEAPSSPLGSRVADESTCLNGNSTLGSCASGDPAGITYATAAQDWRQTISSTLTGGKQAKVTLTPCPTGIDTTSGAGYQVLLSGGGNSEAVNVVPTPGDCTSGASSGTIQFTPFFSYSSGYTIGSASSGLQETVNQACGTNPTTWKNAHCNLTLPASGPGSPVSINTYNIYGTLFWHANESTLTAGGAVLNCVGRGACLQVGDQVNANDYQSNTIRDLTFSAPNPISSLGSAFAGVLITTTAANGSYKTITTATAHNFRPGDMVTVLFTDDVHYWGDSVVYDCGSGSSPGTCTSSSTTFRVAYGSTIASQATPGVVALAYVAVLDNANNTKFDGITLENGNDYQFNNVFDLWDDENTTIEKFNNNAHSLNSSATWTGSFVFAGSAAGHVTAPVINIKNSNFTANGSNCVTDYVNNGLYIDNSVCQASGLWQFHASVEASGYGKGIFLRNIYSENWSAGNSASPQRSPYYGTGQAGLILGSLSIYSTAQVAGQAGLAGAIASGGSGSTNYIYYIVVNDVTAGTHSSPLPILVYASTGSDSPVVNWPRVANSTDTITYDVIRTGSNIAYLGGCGGGSTTACGSVATALSQASACTVNGGLICTYADTASASTASYGINIGNYTGLLAFWPGNLVSVSHSVRVDQEQPGVGVGLGGEALEISANCDSGGQPNSGGYTDCSHVPTAYAQPGTSNLPATVMADNVGSGAQNTAVTGRLNFLSPTGNPWQAHHIITLLDCNPFLTLATQSYRRAASTCDAWIGTDAPHNTPLSTTMLAIGAGQSITQYIANIGSTGTYPYGGSGWLERLTSKQKTFAVPVKINDGSSFTLGNGSPLSQMKIYSVNNMPGSHVPPESCVDVVREAKGLTKSDQITSITPPGRLGNLSLNAYPADEGAIILHFCNPSGSEAITPAGAYSFLAVR
jgi:hypothetical protein